MYARKFDLQTKLRYNLQNKCFVLVALILIEFGIVTAVNNLKAGA